MHSVAVPEQALESPATCADVRNPVDASLTRADAKTGTRSATHDTGTIQRAREKYIGRKRLFGSSCLEYPRNHIRRNCPRRQNDRQPDNTGNNIFTRFFGLIGATTGDHILESSHQHNHN